MQPVELGMEAALLVMRNGGSTVAAERTLNNILAGCKQPGVAVVWRLDFIAVSETADGQSSTLIRPVGPIGVHLTRVAEVVVLGERVAEGKVAIADLDAEIVRIKKLASPYNRWVAMLAAAGIGGALSQFAGGDLGSLGIAVVAAALGQVLRSQLQAGKVPAANVTLICGVLSACLAAVGLRLGISQATSVALVASVVYLAPGLPLINGFVDMASHRYLLVGIERITNAAFLFLILAISIALASTIVM